MILIIPYKLSLYGIITVCNNKSKKNKMRKTLFSMTVLMFMILTVFT